MGMKLWSHSRRHRGRGFRRGAPLLSRLSALTPNRPNRLMRPPVSVKITAGLPIKRHRYISTSTEAQCGVMFSSGNPTLLS